MYAFDDWHLIVLSKWKEIDGPRMLDSTATELVGSTGVSKNCNIVSYGVSLALFDWLDI